ncbi:hypothetical protein ABW21_db0206125 [Orbilia brochopaga]|nr:hypothetical protein ABW21_db0206125 [Drechslerella brochopaga]
MASLSALYARYSRSAKILVSLFLIAVIIAAYALIVLLFIRPQIFNLDSLIHPEQTTTPYTKVTPSVLIALFSAILTGSTTALVTRCVDESLWKQLTASDSRPVAKLSIAESRHLAEWSISTVARLRYLVSGDSWALRISGIFILVFAGVNPVLLSGISQTTSSSSVTTFQPSNYSLTDRGYWDGFLNDVNTWHSSGNVRDLLGESAFLASLNSLSPPTIPICEDELCRINAKMAGYQANCKSTTFYNLSYDQPAPFGASAVKLCSSYSGDVCVTLLDSDPATSANFTNYKPANSSDGDFTIIIGAYENNWSDYPPENITYLVDCKVQYGWVNITQKGRNPPEVLRSSLQIVSRDELDTWLNYIGRIYAGDLYEASPWNFVGGNYGANGEKIVVHPVGVALLGWKNTTDGLTVAQRIERAWDTNNIFALGRSLHAADISTTVETRTTLYVYNRMILLILLVPLFATVLGIWGRWHVQGDELMPGYDPVKIATYGPVYGIPPGLNDRAVDKLKVARYSRGGSHYQFIATGGPQFTYSEDPSSTVYQTSVSVPNKAY